ncbi:pseudouridine synthase [Archaeoglobales archaeon]|nr:MAG: pseudouridine synthase [Archaeoglobales archaeon]
MQRLRKKEAKKIARDFEERFGIKLSTEMDVVKVDNKRVILINDEPILFEHEGVWYPTVLTIIRFKPERGKVVVDRGALPYIMNGADVMRPGILQADEKIKKGDFVYITVEGKDTPIAVGIALVDGSEMIGDKGKVIENIHHVKDKLWNRFFG